MEILSGTQKIHKKINTEIPRIVLGSANAKPVEIEVGGIQDTC
jgi:hypothetical protein